MTGSVRSVLLAAVLIALGAPAAAQTPAHDIDQGNAAYDAGDYQTAISDYTRSIAMNPKNPGAYYDRGNAYRKLDELDHAIADYGDAIRLAPKVPLAYGTRGMSYVLLGRNAPAIDDFTTALRLKPDDVLAYDGRGFARFFTGDFSGARADFARVLQLNPTDTYGPLWLHAAAARAGHADPVALARASHAVDLSVWPAPLVALALGTGSIAEVTAAATKGDERAQRFHACDAGFYLGEDALERNDRPTAKAHFADAMRVCGTSSIEYVGARTELGHLTHP